MRWMAYLDLAWIWVAVVAAASAAPFWNNLREVRSGTPHFPLYVAALAVLAAGAVVYLGLRERVRRWEAAGCVVLVGAIFLVREPVATLLAVWVAGLSFAAGGVLLEGLKVELEDGVERLVLWTGAGLGMVSAAMFVVGLLHGYRRPVLLALLAATTWMLRRRLRGTPALGAAPPGPLVGLCAVFGVASAAIGALVVVTPETTFDPLATHLYEARYYAESAAFRPPPRYDYHYYPKGVEMLQTLGFVLGGQAAAQVLGYLFTPLAAGAVWVLARRRYGTPAAVLAATLVFTTPLVVYDGSVAKNDLGLAAYQMLGLYAFLRWREEHNPAWARAMSLFLGLSFGVKHTALVLALPLFGWIAVEWWRQGRRLAQGAAWVGLAVAAGGYWHVRTWMLAGSPVYPLRSEAAVRPTREKTLVRYFTTPAAILYQPGYRLPEARSPNVMGFAVLGLLPLIFRRGRRGDGVLWWVAGLSYLFWVRSAENLRFLIPIWMLLLIVLGGRAAAYWGEGDRVARAACLALAGYCLLFALQVTILLAIHLPRLEFVAGRLDRREYLRRVLEVYPAVEWLNREVGRGERVCALLTCPRLYAESPLGCYLQGRTDPRLEWVTTAVAGDGCRYVLAPPGLGEWGRTLYQDEHYQVSRVREY